MAQQFFAVATKWLTPEGTASTTGSSGSTLLCTVGQEIPVNPLKFFTTAGVPDAEHDDEADRFDVCMDRLTTQLYINIGTKADNTWEPFATPDGEAL